MYTAERVNDKTIKLVGGRGSLTFTDGRGWSDKRVKKLTNTYNRIEEIKGQIAMFARGIPTEAFGHAFLWGVVKVGGKRMRMILYSGASADWVSISEFADCIEEVEHTWVNWD